MKMILVNPSDDAPISIIVEGTTVESTDVDTVPDLNNKSDHNKDRFSNDSIPVTRRVGAYAQKSRPVSDGHILVQDSWPSKV